MNAVAKRGGLVITVEERSDLSLMGGRTVTAAYSVGVVTSITREGVIKAWRDTWGTEQLARHNPRVTFQVGSKDRFDVDGAYEMAKAHTWPGRPTPKDWDSLDELKAALRPYRR